jgi:hypothetical protein
VKSRTSVGGSAGAPFGPSKPDAGRNRCCTDPTASVNVPSVLVTSTGPGVIFGCGGLVRVRFTLNASRRIACSTRGRPSTSAGLQSARGFVTSSFPPESNRSPTSVPGRGTNDGRNFARTGPPW